MLPEYDPDVSSETAALDFKSQFDPNSRQDCCELVKDLVAMANSGGGCIFFGVNDDGTLSGWDTSPILNLDPATLANRIHSYTEQQFGDFEVVPSKRQGQPIAVLRVGAVRLPIVFTAPGTYATGPTSQKTAFAKGTVYFRHGSKSEPGTTEDLRQALDRELALVKGFWLDGITKIVAAPPGSTVQVVQQDVSLRYSPTASPIRLTADDGAPVFRAIQADELYPHRQKELLKALAGRLGPNIVGSYDLLCVRRVHGTDENPTFTYKAQWSPRQYSDAFLEWLAQEHTKDPEFFAKARETHRHPTKSE